MTFSRPLAFLVWMSAWLAPGVGGAQAEPIPVTVVNKSVPTLCAEDDNVYLTFENPKVGGLVIEARPPAAIGAIVVDQTAPDFTDCAIADAPPDPNAKPDSRLVLHEDEFSMLVGHRHAEFWREADVGVRVGDRREAGIHLLQLFLKTANGPYEYLVLYPQDGYWRARPLPPARLSQTAYGTSFLVGPVEDKKRPLVALKEVVFDPLNRAFDLSFERGGQGRVRVASVGERATVLDVTLEPGISTRPFAALRSMFILDTNADAAVAGWREPAAKGWSSQPVMAFKRATATEFWLGRSVISRHNTSAPDTVLRGFRGVGPGP
jgi:hypothetical protein